MKLTPVQIRKIVNEVLKEFENEFNNKKYEGTMWYMDNNIFAATRWLNRRITKLVKELTKE